MPGQRADLLGSGSFKELDVHALVVVKLDYSCGFSICLEDTAYCKEVALRVPFNALNLNPSLDYDRHCVSFAFR